MRICTYERSTSQGSTKRLGIFANEQLIVDPNFVMQAFFEKEGFRNTLERATHHVPPSLSAFLKIADNPIAQLQAVVGIYFQLTKEGILKTQNGADLAFDTRDSKSFALSAPIDDIATYRDFFVHEKHVKIGFAKRNEPVPPAWYEMPVYYKGATTGFIGTEAQIPWPSFSKQLDYELELAVVIGRDGKNIKAKDAYKHIFGFTILNDVSARDIQRKEMAARLGPAKGKDWCSVIGPVIVTADEFGMKDPDLLMTAAVNGVEWSRGRSGEAKWSWGEMIEHLTQDEWIRATDLLGSGTVGTGCGLELDKWIQPGDVVELEIERIGKIKNLIGTPTN
ncbi:MAG: fumarylacetoacetate hydrolase family protein [Bacteriovoracaceae bacterium]|nr:fumarylacetoacetate hydrolase family protein [Bacteriovoracaceae bacterium]